jgi:hypothetical protein
MNEIVNNKKKPFIVMEDSDVMMNDSKKNYLKRIPREDITLIRRNL